MTDLEYYQERLTSIRKTIARIEDEGVEQYTDDGLEVRRIRLKDLAERETYYETKIGSYTTSSNPATAKRKGNIKRFIPLS